MATIAISDDLGPLGSKIARDLGKSLNLRYIDGAEIEDMVAKQLRLTRTELDQIIDGSPGPIDRWTINRKRLGEVLGRQLIDLADQEDVILRYVGSAAILHSRGNVVCVRLKASNSLRARVIADHFLYGDLRMAYWDLESTDVDLEKRAQLISPVNWRSSHFYDAILDPDSASHLGCVEQLIDLVKTENRTSKRSLAEKLYRSYAARVNKMVSDFDFDGGHKGQGRNTWDST